MRRRATTRQRLPIGYAIDFATYQAEQVSASVNSALSSVAQTFIVVAALVVLFLGLRAGIVAAMIVPFAVMFSLIGMRALGIALEQVSIAAIIIALGLLVDNGVVIVEDIVSRIGRGVPAQEAGAGLGRAVCTSAADLLGHHDRRVPAAVAAVGIVRRICVLAGRRGGLDPRRFVDHGALHPARADRLAHRPTRPRPAVKMRPPPRMQRFYASALRSALRFSPIVLAVCIVLVVLALTLFDRLPKQMFPLSERNQFLVYMNMPDGTDISQTEARALEISQMARRQGSQSRNRQPDPLRRRWRPKVLSDA